ncbi:hypothetical protein MLD38_034020 [Melastoma candidum]|uniref:Uncharacterized protein n=1 Tax=Melastoma candidum TaxID=119954 RepID=A0ACB9MCI4_9MYRT|nr:hypothetical protein MLD38_034020 [Melastoma candidum]
MEEPMSSCMVLSKGVHEQAMGSIAVEDNTGPVDEQVCMIKPQLIEKVGQEGDNDAGDLPVGENDEIQNRETEAVHKGIEEICAEEFGSRGGEQIGSVFSVESDQCIEQENQKNVNEASEDGVEVRITIGSDHTGLGQRDVETVGESSNDMSSSGNCVAGIDFDSFNHLIERVNDMPSMMTNGKFPDKQENQMCALESAESTCTMHQTAVICTVPGVNHSDHNTDTCSVAGLPVGKEDGGYDREAPFTECAISREVTMDEGFFGDMNKDCDPWPWWKNSTGVFSGGVSLANAEEDASDEISCTLLGKASCDTYDVPMDGGLVYSATFREISDYHRRSRFGCSDHLSPYDSDNFLEGKPVDDCLVSERPSVEETEVTDKPEGVGPSRAYLADGNGLCVTTKSSLNSSRCRSGRKTQAKRAAQNSVNANKELYSLAAAAFNEKTVKKKRTNASMAARASVWGALNNISQLFEETKGPEFKLVKSRKSKKSGVEQTNENTRKSTKRNANLSENKSTSSVTRIRLKVKLGKETIGSTLNKEMMDSDVPTSFVLRDDGSIVTKDLCGPNGKTRKQYECLDHEDCNISVGPLLASSLCTEFMETNFNKAGGNVERKYTEIPNYAKDEAVSDGYLDPETSPDSEVINMVPEVEGVERSREHVSGVDLSHIQNNINHEGFHVQGKNGHAPSQGLQPQQDGSLRIQNDKENIAGLESGLGSSSLETPDPALYKGLNCKANSRPSKSAKSRKSDGSSRKGDRSKSEAKYDDIGFTEFKMDRATKAGSADGDAEEYVEGANTGAENILSSQLVEQDSSPRNAWVRCDDCFKWRRISVALADVIEDTNSSWTCKENLDRNFADCSVSQEKSNDEINKELELSDASGEEDENDSRINYKQLEFSRPTGLQQSSFVHIDSNKFSHRNRRTQSIDEVMVCHCKPYVSGCLGCGDECLNRMLNIECVQDTCPCGDLCSNQQFQQRKYANMQWFRCGKKGFGLQLLEDVHKGTFIIEYVGEVLDMATYEARQRDYAAKGHKHFYFMTLNGSEVIDASAKGNLGRFINHSCDPNCQTEKWMVNGEICIGLFAIRDIKKGEELTFDYNYVRVFGAAVKKCVCGSRHCRGYIGGDPLNSEVVIQSDSDDEFPEPVMLTDGDTLDHFECASRPRSLDLATELKGIKSCHELKGARISPGAEESVHQFSLPQMERLVNTETKEKVESCSLPVGIVLDTEFTGSVISDTRKLFSFDVDASRTTERTSPKMSKGKFSDDMGKGLKSAKSNGRRNSPKLHTLVKMSKFANAFNKDRENPMSPISSKVQGMGGKSPMMYTKSRRLLEASSCGRFEAVEEKLNELLDADGGISKRRDAAKGYLKLLFLTAASGDCANGGAIQSNRDLSMILDAVLKTRSRVVLIDIISKNGLQMLHNTLKQYRRDFNKIPILRKLLKVLEYLASREILTLEHISSGPPYPGLESFRESILSLAEHDDKQVHQSARNFRDKYIPKSMRKICHNDRAPALPNNWHDSGIRPTEAIDCLDQSVLASTATPNGCLLQDGATPSVDNISISGRRVVKRKSRWDQPGDPVPDSMSHQQENNGIGDNCLEELSVIDKKENCSEDVPPGFSPGVDMSQILSNTTSTTTEVSQLKGQTSQGPYNQAVGQLQERFNSRLPVSYGIPLYILQNLGKPQADTVGWVIAPGMPFHPFPPLPQYPRDRKGQSPIPAHDYRTKNIYVDRKKLDESCTTSVIEDSSPGTSTADTSDENICSDNQPSLKRLRASPQDLSKNYFKQQKWNTTKVGPPWLWRRKCWGFSVRGGSGSSSIENVVNGNESSHFTEN